MSHTPLTYLLYQCLVLYLSNKFKTICTAQMRSVHAYTLCYCSAASFERYLHQSEKLPLDKLINQQEGILAYKVINGTYLLNDFLNHGGVIGIKSNLEILLTWGYHYMQQLNLNSLFAIEPSIRGMAYQVTCATHHHSVLSRIKYYNSCICLSHSFQI